MHKHDKPWFLQERLVFGLVVLLSATGLFSWFNINQQEDPFFPYRNGYVTIGAPGMSVSALESTIIRPFERTLASIDGIANISSSISDGHGSVDIELQEYIDDTDLIWQKVRDKVNEARSRHLSQVSDFTLNDKDQDTAGILLVVHTDQPLLAARRYALAVRDELYQLPQVREISLVGDTGEQIEVVYSQKQMLEMGISPLRLARQIEEANGLKNIGTLMGEGYQSNIGSMTRINNVDDVGEIEIKTKDHHSVRLSELAKVVSVSPPLKAESFWLNGKQVLGLSIIILPDALRVTDFGHTLLAVLEQLNSRTDDFTVEPVFFQPEWTQKRSDDLVMSLLYGSIGVGLVLFFLMSRKIAFVVTLTIPAIALSTIAFFGMSGGVLQQMSIAGLVISLGLMVDNSIVVSELISRYRQKGMNKLAASYQAVRDLYKPLATSTFTTIAAFVPMLLSQGNVADFIRAIPVVVIIGIVVSYVYSLVFLPAIANNLNTFREGRASRVFANFGLILGRVGTRYPWSVLLAFGLLVGLSFYFSESQSGEFFPKSGRNQIVIDVEGNFGASHDATLKTVKALEDYLHDVSDITEVISFVGHSGPAFYYNLSTHPNEPNIARVVVETQPDAIIPSMVKELNLHFSETFSSVRVNARDIGQGPPIEAPIEIRVLGNDANSLLAASEEVFTLINQQPLIIDSRRAYDVGKPKLTFEVDEFNLQKAGISRTELSQYIAWRTTGIPLTSVPSVNESLDVVLRDNRNINEVDTTYIMNTHLFNGAGEIFPLSLFLKAVYTGETPVMTRRNGFLSHVIKGDVVPGHKAAVMLQKLAPEIQQIANRYQVTLEMGGEAEEEASSNDALLKTLPVGVLLLFAALILQFNSFRIAGLVMLTIPLAMLGVYPTLSLVGVNFGFMSVLGILALTGIVVNTAIILIDNVMMKIQQQDLEVTKAIESAISERLRPIFLTACTTIVGMIPLTSPSSPLWPPLAWTIIGGLLTSTVLALLVLPALLQMVLTRQLLAGENL